MTQLPSRYGIRLIPAFAVLCGSCLSGQDVSVRAIRHSTTGQVTRVAIELSGPAEIRQDRLSKPERYFIDFQGAAHGRKGMAVIRVASPTVQQVRAAQAKPGVARVVLDLEGNPEVTTSELANPFRLILEVRPRGVAVPAEPVISHKRFVPPPVRKPVVVAVSLSPPPVIPLTFRPGPAPLRPWLRLPGFRTSSPSKPVELAKLPPPAEAAKRTASGANSMTRALGLKLRKVMLDPGHGGHDQGSSGPTGLLEKELVLDVAQRLGELISTNLGSEVVYTRDDDRFIPLETRTKLANESKADLFLSIHANSSVYRSVTGVETYYLSFTNSKEALEVAARENATSDRSVFELKELLQKIAMQDKINESKEFATRVNTALYRVWGQAGATRNRGVKKVPFVVLIGASMPSVLAEIGFLSNPKDELEMKKPEVRQKIAEALYRGIAQYAESLSHFNVARRATAKQTN